MSMVPVLSAAHHAVPPAAHPGQSFRGRRGNLAKNMLSSSLESRHDTIKKMVKLLLDNENL